MLGPRGIPVDFSANRPDGMPWLHGTDHPRPEQVTGSSPDCSRLIHRPGFEAPGLTTGIIPNADSGFSAARAVCLRRLGLGAVPPVNRW